MQVKEERAMKGDKVHERNMRNMATVRGNTKREKRLKNQRQEGDIEGIGNRVKTY